jgi:hypothetical protein
MMPMLRNSQSFLYLIAAVIELTLFTKTMHAQEIFHLATLPSLDSLQYSSLSFSRVLNTYVWSGDFQKGLQGQMWNIEIRQHIRSRFVNSNQVSIQDEYQGLISLQARLSEKWNFQVKNTSNVLADNRVIDFGKMAQHQVLAGFEYIPAERMTSKASAGYELNSQVEESDRGFTYALGFDAHRIKLDEFDASLSSSWDQSFLGQRSPQTGVLKLILLRDFGGGIDDSLSINYSTQRREFYTSFSSSDQTLYGAKHNMFRRTANAYEIMNQTTYDMDERFSLHVSFGLSNRLIDRDYRFGDVQNPASLVDSRIQEMQFFGTLALRCMLIDWLNADFRLNYIERDERHSVLAASAPNIDQLFAQANKLENTAQRTMFTMALTADLTAMDRICVISSVGLLRYDTPDVSNTDDRDELLATFGSEILHRFSSRLLLRLTADLTLFHLVYLSSEQSANNNWNRVLRLSPCIEYVPAAWFRTVARAEVLANYTVSDYEQQIASIRSFSFRQAMWSDSSVLRISRRIQCNMLGSLRIFERGILKWKEYKEKPEEYVVEKTLWPEFVWLSAMGVNMGIGFRYFGQDRYKYLDNRRVFDQRVETMGPTVFLEWSGPGSERVTLSGWREEQKNNGITKAKISNLSMQVGLIL